MQWYIYLRGNTQGFQNKTFNPVFAKIKNKSKNLPDKICIKEPFTIALMKRQRSVAPQQGKLKV